MHPRVLPLLVGGLLLALVLPLPAIGQGEEPAQPADSEAAVIGLSGGSAGETARLLDEMYNGSGTDRRPRVVVHVIPLTNCLLVRGTSVDLLTVRELLRPL
jgi:hypothetical protein